MAIVVGTDSFVSVADADTYNTVHGNAGWATATEANKEIALVQATQYLTSKYDGRWVGYITSISQVLPWPRSGVLDQEGRTVASDAYPLALTDATSELAFKALTETINADVGKGGQEIRKKVGSIEKEWMPGTSPYKKYTLVDRLLAGFITGDSTSATLIRR